MKKRLENFTTTLQRLGFEVITDVYPPTKSKSCYKMPEIMFYKKSSKTLKFLFCFDDIEELAKFVDQKLSIEKNLKSI